MADMMTCAFQVQQADVTQLTLGANRTSANVSIRHMASAPLRSLLDCIHATISSGRCWCWGCSVVALKVLLGGKSSNVCGRNAQFGVGCLQCR